jgi:two-component system response regulator DegU
MPKIKLMIVDDLEHVRQGLRTLLGLSEDIEIIGQAMSGFEAIGMAMVLNPEVVLMDMEMPKMDGLEASKWIKEHNPDIRIVMITIHNTEILRAQSRAAGVDVFVAKATPTEILIDIIKELAQ